jgi:SAM-dependent methyltransferase
VRKELKRWRRENSGLQNVLDAGSGFGQYTYNLLRKNRDYTVKAIDISQEHVDACRGFFGKLKSADRVSFEQADLTSYRVENEYNLILSVDVMEHILKDELVFKNFLLSLRSGGMLLISTPSDQGGSDVHHESDESFIGEHVRDGYSVEEIEGKLKKAGFNKVIARYSYGKPGKISWRLSMKYPIMMLNFSKFLLPVLLIYYLFTFPICLFLNYLDLIMTHSSGTGLIVKAWK